MTKLLDQARDLLRTRHYSIRTEEACIARIRDFSWQKLHPALRRRIQGRLRVHQPLVPPHIRHKPYRSSP